MRPPWSWQDATLAGLLLVLLVTEILPNAEMTPRLALLALSMPLTVPLVVRRSFPAVVAVVVCAANLGMVLVATGPFPPQLAIFPVLVGVYSAALRTRGAVGVLTGALTAGLMVSSWLISEEGHADDFWPWLLWAGAWAGGTFVRRRTDLAAHHAARVALLEVEARTTAADSAQRERDRIARELHDVVAHAVSVMVVQAGAERLRLGAEAGRTGRALEAIEESGRAALTELRTMLGVLRDGSREDLAPLPGLTAVPGLVDRIRDTGQRVELVAVPAGLLGPGSPEASSAIGLAAYRIVQEALTNVVRHAGGAEARVAVTIEADSLEVSVTNGPPHGDHPPHAGSAGRGLGGMGERVLALGGTLESGPHEGGYRVHAVLPLAQRAAR